MRIATLGLFLLASCGAMNAPDLDEVDAHLDELKAAMEVHCAPSETAPSCETAVVTYQASVREPLEQLEGHGGPMDECMREMNHGDRADFAHSCRLMRDELGAYATSACQSDVRREAHCASMRENLDRIGERTSGMRRMMGGGGIMGGGMMGHHRCNP